MASSVTFVFWVLYNSMKYKYIIFFLIALCAALLFLLGYKNERAREIADLRREIKEIREQVELIERKAQYVIDEVRTIMDEKFVVLDGIRLIPVFDYRTFVAVDEKEMNNQ